MDKTVIKQKNSKLFGYIIGSVIFLVLSILMLIQESAVIIKIIGFIGILFSGSCFTFTISRFIKPKYILVISEEGFIDNSTGVSIGFISWEYVERIFITSFRINSLRNEKWISVEINNKDAFEKKSKIKMMLIKLNRKLGYAPINISLNTTGWNLMETIKIMQEYLETYKRQKMLETDSYHRGRRIWS